MAISSIGSYPPTLEQFIAHWTEVNAAISPSAFTLTGGYGLADFTADRDALVATFTPIIAADNVRQGAAADRDSRKAALRPRMFQFRGAVIGMLAGSKYVNMQPVMPIPRAAESKFLRPFDDMADVWNSINTDTIPGFTGPLLLAGGYALADFNADLAALRAAYIAATDAENGSRSARATRNVLLKPLRARMVQYRQAVKAALPMGSPLLLTIPALTPPPGSTPDPVALTGVMNTVTGEGDFTWTASTNPHLDHYELRISPGPTYKTADESTIASIPKTQLTYSTSVGLGAPGATGLYKLYAVLDTLNERGSNTVGVTRP